MFFRNIIYSAIIIGIISGLTLSLGQHFQVSQIIYQAETYESAGPTAHEHGNPGTQHSHQHNQQWAPEDGAERIFYTVIADILTAIGFSCILLALMSIVRYRQKKTFTLLQGVAWGVAGFVAVFVAPSLGMHPEIPGMQAAMLEHRQIWWLATVLASIAGLLVLAFVPGYNRFGGLILLAIPHIIGAPETDLAVFSQTDPQIVASLTELHQSFLWASAITNAAFWLLLGILSTIALKKWQWND